MNGYTFEIGDVIAVNRPGYKHVGVFVGLRGYRGETVVHNCKGDGVMLSTLDEFADGANIYLRQKADGDYRQREKIARRALNLIGKKYNLLKFNCEHAANLAQREIAESPQIVFAFFALIALVFVWLFLTKKV